MKQFTVGDAIVIQHEQLQGWKKVLNSDVYVKLLMHCVIGNTKAVLSGKTDDVPRGQDLTEFVLKIKNETK